MNQDILNNYRQFLCTKFCKNTADTYYHALRRLYSEVRLTLTPIMGVSVAYLEQEMLKIKNRNDFSAAKNALINLKKLYPSLQIPTEEFFRAASAKKRNWSKKPKNVLQLDTTKRKINALRDKKFKLAFRLGLVSGLRVSELAALTGEDITIDGDFIRVNVKKGKGGSSGAVECMPDHYLAGAMGKYLEDFRGQERIFHSAGYMKEKAAGLGLQCHDLRRIASIRFRRSIIKDVGAREANQRTKEFLRHKRFSTTKRYLFKKRLVEG